MRAVRYDAGDGEPRLGRLEDEHIVDAGPAGAIGFDARLIRNQGVFSRR